ncbi:MAG: hypothetical protein AAGF12_02605 [Myxococcota bacterium]
MSETAKKQPESIPTPSTQDEQREELLREVTADATERPEEYLRGTEVREGGE